MNLKTLILVVGVFFSACSQNKNTMISQNPNINDNNLVEEIIKSVKHYPNDKINILSYDKHFCDFEVFVNGLSVYKKFDNESGSSAFDINPYVFKTGEYNVKYKLYSVNKEDESSFKENTIFNLSLESYSLNSAENEKTHFKYSIPYLKNEFIATNKNIFEDTFKIKIEVPYTITPDFENAQDLTKLDKKHLEQKVLEKYNQIREVYTKKNVDDIAKLIYAKTILEFQTTYADKEKVAGYWKLYKNILLSDDFTMLPIENYKMEFFYDGRLVTLISQSKEPKLRNEPALAGRYKNQISSIKHYLYLPKGETEFKVY